jgi:hypothetical protein
VVAALQCRRAGPHRRLGLGSGQRHRSGPFGKPAFPGKGMGDDGVQVVKLRTPR